MSLLLSILFYFLNFENGIAVLFSLFLKKKLQLIDRFYCFFIFYFKVKVINKKSV